MDRCRSRGIVRFGLFEADLHAGELRKDGTRIRLQEQPFQVLTVLLEHPGELITREELRRRVWPEDTFVEFDHALNTAVKKIRVALSDDALTPRYVETIPKRGYRWIAPVHPTAEPASVNSSPESQALPIVSAVPVAASRIPIFKFVVGAAFTMILLALLVFHLERQARARTATRPLLVVLPFENWSDNPAQIHVCRGITEDVITELASAMPRVQIAPNAMAKQYENTTKSVAEIGRELGADYVLQGNLRSSGQRLRLNAELVRVHDLARLWGENFDQGAGDPVEVEGNFARSITARVQPILSSVSR
jgi:TolB-like protein/DNA-binding winged helix-turn-helix (wHTH) protein